MGVPIWVCRYIVAPVGGTARAESHRLVHGPLVQADFLFHFLVDQLVVKDTALVATVLIDQKHHVPTRAFPIDLGSAVEEYILGEE